MHAPFERFSLIFLGCAVATAALAVIVLFVANPGAPSPGPRSAQLPMATAATAGTALGINDDPEERSSDFDLDAVAAGAAVPRARNPGGVPRNEDETGAAEREDFVRRALPLVLLVNEEILADRSRLWVIRQRLRAGEYPTAGERLWMGATAERFGVARDAIVEMTRRIDAVPPSLSLAIVAIDPHRRGKLAAYSGDVVPAGRGSSAVTEQTDGAVRSSANRGALLDTIRRHVHALNTSPKYEAFRLERERLRQAGVSLSGPVLVETLPAIQSQAWPGTEALRKYITHQRLDRFDAARLQPFAGPA